MNTEYEQEIITIIAEFVNVTGTGAIKNNMNLFDELGVDSIKIMQIIIELEDYYHIEIPDSALVIENFETVQNISTLISELKKQ